MPKNKKQETARLRRKAAYKVAVETADRLRTIAENITDNGKLRTMLMQVEDVQRRKELFDFLVPHLRFRNPEFPSMIQGGRIILP